MAVKTTHIPIAMLLRKFYCHRCGSQLTRHPNTTPPTTPATRAIGGIIALVARISSVLSKSPSTIFGAPSATPSAALVNNR